jgi:hypothetical protein
MDKILRLGNLELIPLSVDIAAHFALIANRKVELYN